MKEEFKYRLNWSGRQNNPTTRAALEHVKSWPLSKDSELQLISYIDFRILVINGQVHCADYWNVKEGEIGVISLSYYAKYSSTWDNINTARQDFEDGWRACEKGHKYLEDWDEAIRTERVRKDALRIKNRTAKLEFPDCDDHYLDVTEIASQLNLTHCYKHYTRNNVLKLHIALRGTVEQLEEAVRRIENNRYWHK
jgi:hypothetical protein